MCFYLHFVGQLVVSWAFLFVLDCHVLLTPPCYSCLYLKGCPCEHTCCLCVLIGLWVFELCVPCLCRIGPVCVLLEINSEKVLKPGHLSAIGSFLLKAYQYDPTSMDPAEVSQWKMVLEHHGVALARQQQQLEEIGRTVTGISTGLTDLTAQVQQLKGSQGLLQQQLPWTLSYNGPTLQSQSPVCPLLNTIQASQVPVVLS